MDGHGTRDGGSASASEGALSDAARAAAGTWPVMDSAPLPPPEERPVPAPKARPHRPEGPPPASMLAARGRARAARS
eukprot:13080248-Alexandrium_andersonii.AAC.2